jgi:hypothetical protein
VRGCEEELVVTAARSSQSEAVELQDALEVGKQHLDLLAQPPRGVAFPRFGHLARHVAGAFVDRARHLPSRRVRAAPGFESASRAFVLKCAVQHRRSVIHARPGRGQRRTAGTVVDVVLVIVGEVVAREGAVLARRFVEHGYMRLNAVLVDQPAEHLGRAVGAIAHEPGGIEAEAIHRALNHALGGQNVGLLDGHGGLYIDDDRMLDIDQVICGVVAS